MIIVGSNSVLDVMVQQIIFRDVSRVDRASDDQFSSHGASIDHFDQIHEVLLGFEASHKLGMIWRSE